MADGADGGDGAVVTGPGDAEAADLFARDEPQCEDGGRGDGGVFVGLVVSTAWDRGPDVHAVRVVLKAVPCGEEDGFEAHQTEAIVPVKPDTSGFSRVERAEVSFDLRAGCYAATSALLGEGDKRLPGCPADDVVIDLLSQADREQGGEAPHRHIQFYVACAAQSPVGGASVEGGW